MASAQRDHLVQSIRDTLMASALNSNDPSDYLRKVPDEILSLRAALRESVPHILDESASLAMEISSILEEVIPELTEYFRTKSS